MGLGLVGMDCCIIFRVFECENICMGGGLMRGCTVQFGVMYCPIVDFLI